MKSVVKLDMDKFFLLKSVVKLDTDNFFLSSLCSTGHGLLVLILSSLVQLDRHYNKKLPILGAFSH